MKRKKNHIKMKDMDSADIVRSHYKDLDPNQYLVVQVIPPESYKRWQRYDQTAYSMRQQGF